MSELAVPDHLWENDTEAVVVAWMFDEGDEVEAGDVVAEVMIEKVDVEIVAHVAGVLRQRKAVDEVVVKGDVLAMIEV